MRLIVGTLLFCALLNPAVSGEYQPGEVGYAYKDADTSAFLVKVLTAMNKKYRKKVIDDSETIFWVPDSETQKKEVEGRVTQYLFVRDTCRELPAPLPEDPVNWNLSCTK